MQVYVLTKYLTNDDEVRRVYVLYKQLNWPLKVSEQTMSIELQKLYRTQQPSEEDNISFYKDIKNR